MKHGMSNTRLYNIWRKMKNRCSAKTGHYYKYYGAKGITVCDEWKNDFLSFYNWAIAHGYSDDLTIDRIDGNGNYCPENCRWATSLQQGRNKSNNHLITYQGKTQTISQWAKELNINWYTLFHRLSRGMPLELAMAKQIGRRET